MENSPFNRRLGIEPEHLDDGRVRLHVVADASFLNEVGVVHGGLAAMLLDGAMGRAMCRTMAEGEACATVQLSVQFLAPAPVGERITATARVVRRGRRVAFVEGECHAAGEKLIARAQGTWAVFAQRPSAPAAHAPREARRST